MNYLIFPVIEQFNTSIPLLPHAVPLEEALDHIKGRMAALRQQGYWRDDRGQQIPLKYVGFHLITEAEWNEQDT